MAAPNPFDYINEINEKRGQDLPISGYSPFLVNRGLSYFRDTVLLANEMNAKTHIDPDMQFEFYKHAVTKKKRFSKWAKAETNDDVNAVMEYYQVSRRKADEILAIINKENLATIKERLFKGGKQ